jgi:hypothetical protein
MDMTQTEQIAALTRDVRRLRIALSMLLVVGAGAMVGAAAAPSRDARFATVTAERINIVEPNGLFRAVLTNGARSPGPMRRAREGAREGKRNFPVGGLILYDQDGQEQGGYGTGAAAGQGWLGVSTLDWPGSGTGGFGEAVSVFRRIDDAGSASSAIQITDRPPPGEDPTKGVDHRRIKLQNLDRDAEIALADAAGRDRIRLRVDRAGEASIEIVDAAGRTVFRAPQR